MKLSSLAFKDQGDIPVRYTDQGEGLSPPLKWENAPEGTVSFALICEDPDAPNSTFTHWVLYNIPSTMHDLPEGLTQFPHGMKSALNSVGTKEYFSPSPPSGTHRYYFTIYALDTLLDLPQNATKGNLLREAQGHVLGQATLMGHYTKEK